MAVPFVLTSVLPAFRTRSPRIDIEAVIEDRFVDIAAEGYDAGIRLTEAIERDMIRVKGAREFARLDRHTGASEVLRVGTCFIPKRVDASDEVIGGGRLL